MSDSFDTQLSLSLQEFRWAVVTIPPSDLGPLSGVFESTFAISAFVFADEMFESRSQWRHCQDVFANIFEYSSLSRDKDRYLIFIISEISQTMLPHIEAAMADTHFARKLCLECHDRPLREVIAQSIVLAGPRVSLDSEATHNGAKISEAILEDLGTRSAMAVLDRLLEGTYET